MPNQLKRAIEAAARAIEPATRRWPAVLCDSGGDTTPSLSPLVAGQPDFVYAVMPDGSTVKAYNGRVPSATGQSVWVGYEPTDKTFLVVLGFRGGKPPAGGPVPGHHRQHEWLAPNGGWDVVYSQARQLMPLRVNVVSGFTVQIEPSPVLLAAGWDMSDFTPLDLSGDVPTIGALYVLLYLDVDGVFSKRVGTNAGPFLSLTYADIPDLGDDESALAAAKLYAGQTALSEDATHGDLVDLRFATGGRLGGGGTGSGFGVFNVMDYGAIGDFIADDTLAVQAAIDAAHTSGPYANIGGIVWFPPGVYNCGNLISYRNVSLHGSGLFQSQIVATAAGSLITIANTTWANAIMSGTIKDLLLYGNSVGTTGLEINGANLMLIERVISLTFTGTDFKLRGVIGSTIRNCTVNGAPLGIDLADQTYTDSTYIEPNLNQIENCGIFSHATYGIKVAHGALNTIKNCDFEGNGTNANLATGGMYFQTSTTLFGLRAEGCWFENNRSQDIFIDEPLAAGAVSTVSDCIFVELATLPVYSLRVKGATFTNTVLGRALKHYTSASTADYYADGASAVITLEGCNGTTGGTGTITVVPPQPATTVVSETAFGQSAAVGTGTLFARNDHTHGTPTAPAGGVTSVGSGTGLTGGPITSTGTLALANTAVAPGSFTNADITVDAQGRLTAAANGSAGSGSGSGAGQAQAITRWIADGAATAYLLPDVAEAVDLVFDDGFALDPFFYTVAADGFTITFDSAPEAGHILQALYSLAQL